VKEMVKKIKCKKCGSINITRLGQTGVGAGTETALPNLKNDYKCNDCGKKFSGPTDC
jgi:rubredoxin